MSAEFSIKDSNGVISINLASRITSHVESKSIVYLPNGQKAEPSMFDVGSVSDFGNIWAYVDTPLLTVNSEKLIAPLVSVLVATKATLQSSGSNVFRSLAPLANSSRCYVVVLDERGKFNITYSSSITITVGRY